MKRLYFLIALAVVATGCSTEVIRKDPSEIVDFSGRWNDSDARMTAEEMIGSCLEGQWLTTFNKEKGRDPVVIVGSIDNRTSEHIDSAVFVDDLEQALVNSGRVRFVSAKAERSEVREERADQQLNSAVVTRAQMMQETGADFMLKGSIKSVSDDTRNKYAVLFQVNLELVNMTTNEKAWIGQKKIKKVVKYPKYSL